jgi:hypothetical protein
MNGHKLQRSAENPVNIVLSAKPNALETGFLPLVETSCEAVDHW